MSDDQYEQILERLERLETLLTQNNERIENLESKIDKLSETGVTTDSTKATKEKVIPEDDHRCEYITKNGSRCPCKKKKGDDQWCTNHPTGITRNAYKKAQEEGTTPSTVKTTKTSKVATNVTIAQPAANPSFTFKNIAGTDLKIFQTPRDYKNIICNNKKNSTAYFSFVSDGIVKKLEPVMIERLENNGYTIADDDEQEAKLAEVKFKWDGKKTSKVETPKVDSDDEDTPVSKTKKVDAKKPEPAKATKPKVIPTKAVVSSDEEDNRDDEVNDDDDE